MNGGLKMRTRDLKARAEELACNYDEARDEAFNDEFRDMFKHCFNKSNLVLTYDDVQGILDSFTFQEEGEWAMDQALNELEDIADQKHEQMKDERYE